MGIDSECLMFCMLLDSLRVWIEDSVYNRRYRLSCDILDARQIIGRNILLRP